MKRAWGSNSAMVFGRWIKCGKVGLRDRLEVVNFSSEGRTLLPLVSPWMLCLRKQMPYGRTRGGSSTMMLPAPKITRGMGRPSSIQPLNPFFITPLSQNHSGQALLPQAMQRNIRISRTRSFGPSFLDNLRMVRDRKRYWRMLRFYWNTRNLGLWRWKGSWKRRGG